MNPNQPTNHLKSSCGFSMMRVLATLALAFLPLVSAQAANYYWATTNMPVGITTNLPASGNWDAAVNWGGGGYPGASDNAYINGTNVYAPFNITNDITANNIQDFGIDVLYGANVSANSGGAVNTIAINPGTTLSILGPNGFIMKRDAPSQKNGITYNFLGNAMTVNNSTAQVILNCGNGNNANTASTINFSGLTNFNANVTVFGVANSILTGTGGGGDGSGDQVIKCALARTNVITATHTEADYTVANFTNAVDLFRQDNVAVNTSSDAANSYFALGISNGIFADSVGIGRGTAIKGANAISFSTLIPSGSIAGSAAGYSMTFNKKDGSSSAYFRNANGVSRMSLLDVTVNGGGTNAATTGNRVGSWISFVGGTVDMLVDKIWLARNYTNAFSTKLTDAGFGFDTGKVNANTVIVGDMQYTNATFVNAYLYVGSNAVMNVNNNLTLGYTPTNDPTSIWITNEWQTFGQVEVDGNGHLYASQINVGLSGTNNAVIVTNGALLEVTNNIATATNSLNVLSLGSGAQLTLFVNPANTNAFTTNLLSGASPALINIASYSGAVSYPATNVLIHYQTIASHNVHIGTLPPGYNNMQVLDDGAGNIDLIVNTNAPKNLVWQGGQNNLWDHSSTNWIDLALNAPTNITKFDDNDTVTFNNASGVPNNISVVDVVSPASVMVTNWNNNPFVLSAGGGSISSSALTKQGTNSLEIDCPSALSVAVTNGLLIGSGSVSSVTVYANASMNFAGTIGASLTSAGNTTLASSGIINGSVAITGGVLTNAGTLNGSLGSLSSGTLLYNSGLISAAGSPTISTNATLINAGTIYAGTLTVALGGTLVDAVPGSTGQSPGSINVASLLVGGTFYPGDGSISTTKVTDYDYSSGDPLNNPNGRIDLNPGSTTYMEVNMDLSPAQTNTLLLSQNQGFGPSQAFKSINGGTIVITNIGTTHFAAGQSFQLFGYYGTGGNIKGVGAVVSPNNSLNSYPVIQPASPGTGLAWDLSQLIPNGIVRVLSASDPLLNFTVTNVNSYVVGGTNIVTELSWPAANIGGWLEVLNTTLTSGLTATNWTSPGGYMTNSSYVNDLIITNNLIGDPTVVGSATFYRYVYP